MNVHWFHIVVLICIFLMTSDFEHLFMCFFCDPHIFFDEVIVKIFLPIFKLFFFITEFWELYKSWIQVLLVLTWVPDTLKGQNSKHKFGVQRFIDREGTNEEDGRPCLQIHI